MWTGECRYLFDSVFVSFGNTPKSEISQNKSWLILKTYLDIFSIFVSFYYNNLINIEQTIWDYSLKGAGTQVFDNADQDKSSFYCFGNQIRSC